MKHPKTTVLGVLTLIGVVIKVVTAPDWRAALQNPEMFGEITAGIGLIFSADAKKLP